MISTEEEEECLIDVQKLSKPTFKQITVEPTISFIEASSRKEPEDKRLGTNKRKQTVDVLGDAETSTRKNHKKSLIECGRDFETSNGSVVRQYEKYSSFFGRVVEVFFALEDPKRRELFRCQDLSKKFGIHTSRIGMHLHRRSNNLDGEVYQAIGFIRKQPSNIGLKVGSYFVSEKGCRELNHWASTRKSRVNDNHPISSPTSRDAPQLSHDLPARTTIQPPESLPTAPNSHKSSKP
jgi:hypothetical protein